MDAVLFWAVQDNGKKSDRSTWALAHLLSSNVTSQFKCLWAEEWRVWRGRHTNWRPSKSRPGDVQRLSEEKTNETMSKSCRVHNVCLGLFYLQTINGNVLKTHLNSDILGDLYHQTLKREFGEKQFAGLLVLADVTKGHSSRTVLNGLFYATSHLGWHTNRFGGYYQQRQIRWKVGCKDWT